MPLDQIDVDKIGEQQEKVEKEMSFLEHLEELRWHIIRSLVAIVAIGIVLFIFHDWMFEMVIFGPTNESFITYRTICALSNAVGLGDTMCFTPPEFSKLAIGFGETFIMSIKVSFVLGVHLCFSLCVCGILVFHQTRFV